MMNTVRSEADHNPPLEAMTAGDAHAARSMAMRRVARDREREQPEDFSATHPEAVHPLIAEQIIPPGMIWEPACGAGDMVRALGDAGRKVVAGDIVDRGCPRARVESFFDVPLPDTRVTAVVTNPPFKHWAAFAWRGIELLNAHKQRPQRALALLGPLSYLSGTRDRLPLWRHAPPTRVLPFAGRVRSVRNGDWAAVNADGQRLADSPAADYGWIVWVWDEGEVAPRRINPVVGPWLQPSVPAHAWQPPRLRPAALPCDEAEGA